MISIAMTCFNQGHFIKDAIQSIVNQTYKDWELIIVDDASADNSMQMINHYIHKFGIIKSVKIVKHRENEGYGSSLNDAIIMATRPLIAIVDSDDALCHTDALQLCINAHIKHPEVAMTYSNYNECDKNLVIRKTYRTRQIPEGKTYLDGGIRVSHLKVLKHDNYRMTDGINPKLRQAVDKDLTLKIEETGKLLFIDKVLYNYRKHSENLSLTIGKKDKEYQKMIANGRKQLYEEARKRRGLI